MLQRLILSIFDLLQIIFFHILTKILMDGFYVESVYADRNFQDETNGTSPRSLAQTDSEIQASKVSTPL